MYEPVIKWSGSKRSQAEEILKILPREINTYYEPFCGGASVLRRLIESDIKVEKYCCSDINSDLINLWNLIKEKPESIIEHYSNLWEELNSLGADYQGVENKKSYFNNVRQRFNKERNPLDFMFIMRTTTNGMPRYNKEGNFNNSFHVTRNGMNPKRLSKIIVEWSELLNEKGVTFEIKDYMEVDSKEGDFLYLDPPYSQVKAGGMYFGGLNLSELWEWLGNQEGKYVLSFDGTSGEVDNTYTVPKELYNDHKYLFSGNSSFKRTIGKSKDSVVYESIYIK